MNNQWHGKNFIVGPKHAVSYMRKANMNISMAVKSGLFYFSHHTRGNNHEYPIG